jgi:hypothetical protein
VGFVCPDPWSILAQCDTHDNLLDVLPIIDNNDIKSYTIINYLFNIYNNNEIDSRGLLKDSVEISLSLWHKQCIINNNNEIIPIIHKLFKNINKNPQNSQKNNSKGENSKIKIPDFQSYLSYEWILSSYKYIITGRYVTYDFEVLLNTLLSFLNDNLPVIRSKIIKTLSLLINIDPCLILRNNVKDAVTQRYIYIYMCLHMCYVCV